MADICQGGISSALGGSVGGSATGGTWSSSAGGTFSPSATNLNATWTPPAAYSGTATLTLTTSGSPCGTDTDSKNITVIASPTANAGPAITSFCQGGTSAALGGSVGGSATGGTWSSSAGGTFSPSATNLNATWTPPAAYNGTATLTLTTSGSPCGTDTDSKNITVIASPTANAGPAIANFCQGSSSAALGGSVGGSATGGTWSSSAGGTFSPSATNLNATWTPPAAYSGTATLILTTSGGSCGTDTDSKTITVNPLPVPVITGPDDICVTSAGNLYQTAPGMTNYIWTVSAGGSISAGGGSTNNSVTVTWNSTGAQTVRVRYTDGNGCTAPTATIYNVNVEPRPLPSNVQISGVLREFSTLTVSYDYLQGVCFPEDLSQTEISWYKANNSSGSGSVLIATKIALDKTLTLSAAEETKYIQVRVKLHDGIGLMSAVSSTGWIGPVAANEKPSATGVAISGTMLVGNTITGNYTYFDAESDPEGATTFEWYRANSSSGSGSTLITGATAQTYILTNADRSKYIRFKVTPRAQTGTTPGDAVLTGWIGPVVDNPPVAGSVTVSGEARVSKTLTASYQYTDAEGDPEGASIYKWYTNTVASPVGAVEITGANSISYQLTNAEKDLYIGFSVTPVAQAGLSPGTLVYASSWRGPVQNDAPVATMSPIMGSLNVGNLLTGSYVYSDAEGDIESGSLFQWYSANTSGGTYTAIPGETGIGHIIGSGEQGRFFRFTVKPRAATGTIEGTEVWSLPVGPANSQPVATNVQVTGTAAVGSTLSGSYTFSDPDPADTEGISTFRWLRDGSIPIAGASGTTYLITAADEGFKLSFEVTPVSSTGQPGTGTPVQSIQTSQVIDPSPLTPAASQVCIEGIRSAGQVLRGKYFYDFYKAEGISSYQWYRNGVAIPGATGIQYTLLQVEDIDSNADITFGVTPRSSNIPAKVGSQVLSNPLSRIIMPKDVYSVSEADVIISANVLGGVFSGTGVTGNIFSPKAAGSESSPHTISYLLNIVNTAHNCSQQSSKVVTVNPNVSSFVGFNSLYCHDKGEDVITVSGVPPGSLILGFSISDNNGIVSQSGTSVTVDPGRMRPGVYKDVLYFSYYHLGVFYQISQSFNIDSVGTDIRLINLEDSYCEGDGRKYISVEGVYPIGGTADWTGAILTDMRPSSAYAEPTLGTAGSSYPITYRYRSPAGCYSKLLTESVKINPLPDPSFGLDPTYNIDGGPVTLTPVQDGGTFSGNGVSGNKLFPDLAGLGEYEIKYIITDNNNCTASLGKKTLIREAQGTFTDITGIICYSDSTYKVKATGLPGSGLVITAFTNTKNTLVHTPGTANADYSVPAAGPGEDTLTLKYKWDGVDYSISKPLFVDSLGQVLIKNLSDGQSICDNQPSFELNPSILGGTFTGPMSGNYLDPKKALGPVDVTYTYINSRTGCSTTIEVPVIIYPAPQISFAPADVCIEDNADTTFFINNTTSADAIQSWLWEFTDAGSIQLSSDEDGGYPYKSGGLQKVALTGTTVNGCSATKESTFNLGVRPVADFYWKSDCMRPDDDLILVDTTFSTSQIVSRSWRIFDGAEFSTAEKTALYPKTSTGYIKLEYIVRTSYANCNDTVLKDIYIRPTIPIQTDGYFENFEAGMNGWVKGDNENNNTWNFGTPDRQVINEAASGQKAWYTGFDRTVARSEASSIVSPCFDFTLIDRPVIKLKLWKQFVTERDGAVLQYKLGDIGQWQSIGTIGTGINWYNSAVIRGEPGGNQLGWTTLGSPDQDWTESVHTLNEVRGKTDVKLRIAYGSDGTYPDHDGMAFDDIWIGERNRNVLLEHFTNLGSTASSTANSVVNKIAESKAGDVVNIQYHTNFPGTDPFYQANPGDASARILFYGLIRAPYTFIDGGTKKDFANIFDNDIAKIDSNDVTKRSLIASRFEININPQISGGILTVSGSVKALENTNAENLTLFLAVTEKKNTKFTGAAGETEFFNIFRKFIPDAGGILLKNNWTHGETFNINEQVWTIEKVLNNADIEVIVFLQNSITKEVYQAASVIKPSIVVGIENPAGSADLSFSLYPNPAVNRLTISFEEPLLSDSELSFIDIKGNPVRQLKAGAGTRELIINDLGLKPGIYLVRYFSGSRNYGFKKLVISGN
jgi:hypothetical protein